MPLFRLRRWFADAVEETIAPEEPPPPPTAIEWGARALSFLFLATLISLIVYQGVQPPVLPRLVLEPQLDQAELRGEEWALPVTLLNAGSTPIEQVRLAVQLIDGERVVDESELDLALIGPGERVEAEVWFSENPTDYEVRLDVASLQRP